MALQAFPLSPVNPKSLMEITPKNTHRYPVPAPAGTLTPAYVRTITYVGGVKGDDVSVSTANATNDYTPRTQAAKASTLGVPMAQDIARKRGAIAPNQPYPKAGDPAVPAPTITSLNPNTGVAGGADVMVRITGTNFTPWSDVFIGGMSDRYRYVRYISATAIDVLMDCARSTPGTLSVAVTDHGVASTPAATFTMT